MFPPKDSPSFESMDESWEYIQGQEPLPNVAANTDFNQGVERGKYIERTRIIKLLDEQEVEGWFDRGLKQHLIELIKGKK